MAKLKAGEAYVKVSADVSDANKKLEAIQEAMQELKFSRKAIKPNIDTSGVTVNINKINKEAGVLKQRFREAAAAFSLFAGRSRNPFATISSDIRRLNVEMRAFAIGATAATTALAVPLVKSTASLIEFDKALRRAGATGSASAEQIQMMSERAKELGRSTIFTSQQVVEGMKEMLQLGVDVEDAIFNVENVLKLAAAGNLELADSAKIAIGVMNGMQIESHRLAEVVDLLAFTSTKSGATIEDLGIAFSKFGPIASLLGVDLYEAAAAIGTLRDNSIDAEIAGTSLRNILQRVSQFAASGKLDALAEINGDMVKLFQKSGKEILKVDGQFIGLAETIDKFEKATQGISSPQLVSVLKDIAGDREANAFAVLLSKGPEAIKKFKDSVPKGFADQFNEELLGGVSGAATKLESSLDTLKLTFSAVFEDELKDGIDTVRALTNAVEEWIMRNKQSVFSILKIGGVLLSVTAGAIALTGVLTTLSVAITGMASALTIIGTLFSSFVALVGFAISPIGALTLSIGYVGIEVFKLMRDMKDLFGGFSETFSGINKIVSESVKLIVTQIKNGDIEGAIDTVKEAVISSFDVLKSRLEIIWAKIVSFIKTSLLDAKKFAYEVIAGIENGVISAKFSLEREGTRIGSAFDSANAATIGLIDKAKVLATTNPFVGWVNYTKQLKDQFKEIDKITEAVQDDIMQENTSALNESLSEQQRLQSALQKDLAIEKEALTKQQADLELKLQKDVAEKELKAKQDIENKLSDLKIRNNEEAQRLREEQLLQAEESKIRKDEALEKQKKKDQDKANDELERKRKLESLLGQIGGEVDRNRFQISGGFNLRGVQKQFSLAQENRTIEEATKMTAEQTKKTVKTLEKVYDFMTSNNLVFGN